MEELRNKDGLTEAEFLAAYHPGDWPHPSVTADNLIFSRTEEGTYEILLIRRGNHPCMGQWALPGGFLEPEEPAHHAAARELMEETGLTQIPAKFLGVFSDPHRDPRHWTITCAFAALVERAQVRLRAADDAADCRWFRIRWTRAGTACTLTLTAEEETLTARLTAVETPTPLGTDVRWALTENHGLAFDHAKMIAAAMTLIDQRA